MKPEAPIGDVVRRTARRGPARLLTAALLAMLGTSCGDLQRQGQASSYLIIATFQAAKGSEPTKFGSTLLSDVITIVDNVPTVFNDLGQVTFSLGMKDPGSANTPTTPTSANYITVNRYHVDFVRADGRSTPGVDVPYPFDGELTITVGKGDAIAGFTLVRNNAKSEAPLAALKVNPVILSTLARVTFYGHDQTGRGVSAEASISVDFGNFADK